MSADLEQRLTRLAPWQRQQLAAWLPDGPASVGAPGAAVRLVAWIVPEDGPPPALADLRAYLGERVPDYMVPHQFIAADALPRAASGKVDRAVLAEQAGSIDTPQREPQAATNAVEAILAEIWAEVLALDYVGVDENFFELGGDSLLSIRILSRARRAGLTLSPEAFFAHPTISGQARQASSTRTDGATAPASGALPLTPIAHWFFERIPVDPAHWNQCFEWTLAPAVTPAMLEAALRALLRHHDALRLDFSAGENGWQAQIAAPDNAAALTIVDLAELSGDALEQEVERQALACNAGIDLTRGPMLRATLVLTPPGAGNRLLLAIHHLAVDALSWRVLAEDLESLCRQLVARRTLSLPAPTASFMAWSRRLVDFAQSNTVCNQTDYWRTVVSTGTAALPLDHAAPAQANRSDSAASIRLRLDEQDSTALGAQAMARRGSHVIEALLAALTIALAPWRGGDALLIDVEGHGREALFDDLDVSRCVGWFTSVFPFVLQPGLGLVAALDDVVERFRAVPMHGIGHGLLRHLHADPAVKQRLAQAQRSQLLLNFLGSIDGAAAAGDQMTLTRDRREQARSPRGLRAYAIEINAWFSAGRLEIDWQYSRALHHDATMQVRADALKAALQEIAASDWVRSMGAATAADFPLAQLDSEEFARLADLLDGEPEG